MRSDIALRKFLCLSSGFIEDNWILISAFVFNLLKFIVLIGVYEENSTSYKYIAGKGSFIFIISLGNGGFSPLVLHQNSQQLFQRLVSMWNLKSCLWNFHTLYSTVNFEWICESFINFFFAVTACFVYQKTVNSQLHKSSKGWHISLCNLKKKSHLLISPLISVKPLNIGY